MKVVHSFCGLGLALALALAPLPVRAAESLPPPLAPSADGPPIGGDRVEERPEAAAQEAPGHQGPRTVFHRADDFAALDAWGLTGSYAIESGEHITDTPKKFGIRHRLQAAFGVTRWLKLSAEQNMKHAANNEQLRVGVFAPQVRLTLLGMLPESTEQWPLDVSAYFGPRIRIQGRREPSVVFGFGTNTPRGPLHFTLNQAIEVTRANPAKGIESAVGPRYDLGAGYEVGAGFVALAEIWGHAAWSRGGYMEQEHHAGPSILYAVGPARFSVGGAAGWQNEGDITLWDVRGMLTTGLEI